MTYVIKGLIFFFSTLILLEIMNQCKLNIFSTIEGNTGFQDYQDDPMLMAREHESQLSGLKENADGFKKYHKQFDDLEIKVDNHTKHINLLSV
tara:strand:+ start:4736 stop:5014 length:279 start_codon:yes stop_codon:yes gene_type:complete